jgi:hypothetical protein
MNTIPPVQPDDEHAIERLLEALRRKEPAAAPTITITPAIAPAAAPAVVSPVVPPVVPIPRVEEDDLPLLTEVVRAEHALRARSAAVRQRPVDALNVPLPEITPPLARNDAAVAAAQSAEAAEAALRARLQAELPPLIASALHNALPALVAEILQGVQDVVARGQKTEDGPT